MYLGPSDCRRGPRVATYLAALGLLLPLPGPAQARAPHQTQPGQRPIIRARANEVVADFVVVNRHGMVVRGLKASQLEVFDNGARQRVESLRFVAHSVHLRPGNWRAIGVRPPAAEPPAANLTALVFDPIDNAGLPLARRAAVQFVADDLGAHSFAAVFRRDPRLALLQPFTNDPATLDRAIQEATGRAVVQINYQRQYERIKAMTAVFSGGTKGSGPSVSAITRAAAFPSWLGASVPIVANASMLESMLTAANINATASGIQRTRSEMADLRHLVGMLAPFQGRKAVVLFTERLYERNGLKFIFRALVREANRAAVSFYPVDVAGLSIRPDLAALATALRGPTYGVQRGAPVEPHVGNAVNQSQAVLLRELAASTGGAAVVDTNDPAHFMNGIAAQTAEHYELAFTPRSFAPGKALTRHRVVIRIPRHRHWRVYGRKVYYARFAAAPGHEPTKE
ncbi:MAG: VWA domain-containing protein [Terriglobales bacterium]